MSKPKRFMRKAVGLTFAVALALTMLSGCAGVITAIDKIDAFLTGTVVPDVCAVATYYQKYIQGVVDGVGNIPQVQSKVQPYVIQGDQAVANLQTLCQNGALISTINNAIGTVDAIVKQINTIVGAGQAATNTTPAASTGK